MTDQQDPSQQGGASDPEAPPSEDLTFSERDFEEYEEQIETKPTDLPGRQETTRQWLTGAFVALFALVFTVGTVGAFVGGETHQNVSELVNGVLPFVTALGGYVASFYFPQNGNAVGGGATSNKITKKGSNR